MSEFPAIELSNVSLSLEGKQVLTDISFALGSGETLLLLGVTGAGKSVLLKLILGLLKPESGHVRVEGQDLATLSEAGLQPLRKRLGMVFQEGARGSALPENNRLSFGAGRRWYSPEVCGKRRGTARWRGRL